MSKRRRLKAPPVCPTPDKVRFWNQAIAEAALAAILHRAARCPDPDAEVPRRTYPCACGAWHLTKRDAAHAY